MALKTIRLLDRFGLGIEAPSPPLLPLGLQRLLASLALSGAVRRTTVAGTLRPDISVEQALARLRTAVWRAHRVRAINYLANSSLE
jgi:hypothetical protein